MTRVISIFSAKGGVGKTTVATNLGVALTKFNRRVTIVDCNLTTSHLSLYLGIYYTPITLNKVLRGEYSINEAIIDHYTGLKIIPASLSITDLENVDMSKIRNVIEKLIPQNDFILVDSAPGLGREALSGLKSADEVIYVTIPHVPAVLDIVRAQELAREVNVKPIGIILNMVYGERHEMSKAEVEQLTGLPVIASIPYSKEINRSVSLKAPIVALNPKSKVSREFFRLAAFLSGMPYTEETIVEKIGRKLRIIKKKFF